MLLENTIFGVRNKVQIAIERLKQFEPEDGYYVAISGGKDSTVIYQLIKMSGVKADFHYNVTYLDAPETLLYIKRNMPEVIFDYPPKSFWDLVLIKKMLPTRISRWCCIELKERGGEGRTVVTGVRWEESKKRRIRKMVEPCYRGRKYYVHPIIDWTEEDVWQFIEKNNIPYNPLYDKGYKRVGCRCCPFKSAEQRERDLQEYPEIKQLFIRTFNNLVERLREERDDVKWKDGEDVLRWWIYGQKEVDKDQITIFE